MITITSEIPKLPKPCWNRVVLGSLSLLFALSVQAGTTWIGGGGDNNIDTAANWNDGINPAFDGSVTATFATGGNEATIEVPTALAGIIFNADTNFTIDGSSALTDLTGGIIAGIPGTTPRTYAITAPLYTTNQVWNITNNGVSGGTTLIISNQVLGGSGVMTNMGDGTLIFAGSAGANGMGLYVGGGGNVILQRTSGNALGDAPGFKSSTIVNGTLQLNGPPGVEQINDFTYLYVTNTGVFDLNGRTEKVNVYITGNGTGGGALINSSASKAMLTKGVTVAGGIGTINGLGDIEINNAGVSGANVNTLVKKGTNSLILSGNAGGSGAIIDVEAGALILRLTNASSSAVSTVYVNTNGTFRLEGFGDEIYDVFGLVYTTNGGVFDLNGRSETLKILTLGDGGINGTGALINSSVDPALLTNTVRVVTSNTVVGGVGDISLINQVTAFSAGATITKIGNNTLTLGGTNDNTSLAVTVNAGTLVLAKEKGPGPLNNWHAVGGAGLFVNAGGTARLAGDTELPLTINATVADGGMFDLNGHNTTNNAFYLSGAGNNNGGALKNSSITPSFVTVDSVILGTSTSIGGSGDITINANLAGFGSILKKIGNNTLTLTGDNTNFTGATYISGGTLALSGNCTFSNTTLISVTNGAAFDVSGLSSPPFVMEASQILSNSASSTGHINGDIDVSGGTVSASYTAGTAALMVLGGTLTLGAGTVVNVDNTGAQLASGTYTLISKSGGGVVAGTAPSAVTVGGSGAAAAATLQISNGQLDLVVASSSPTPTNIVASVSGNQLVLNWPAGQGWQLQSQTNSLLGTWYDIVGATPPWTNSVDLANQSVFYRLKY